MVLIIVDVFKIVFECYVKGKVIINEVSFGVEKVDNKGNS